jgi:hypothetical protein
MRPADGPWALALARPARIRSTRRSLLLGDPRHDRDEQLARWAGRVEPCILDRDDPDAEPVELAHRE